MVSICQIFRVGLQNCGAVLRFPILSQELRSKRFLFRSIALSHSSIQGVSKK